MAVPGVDRDLCGVYMNTERAGLQHGLFSMINKVHFMAVLIVLGFLSSVNLLLCPKPPCLRSARRCNRKLCSPTRAVVVHF